MSVKPGNREAGRIDGTRDMNEIAFLLKDFRLTQLQDGPLSQRLIEKFNYQESIHWKDCWDDHYQLDIKKDEKGHCLLWFIPCEHYTAEEPCDGYLYTDDMYPRGLPWHVIPGAETYLISKFYKGYVGEHFSIDEIVKGLKGYKGPVEIDDRVYDSHTGKFTSGSRRENVAALCSIDVVESWAGIDVSGSLLE